MPSLDDIISFNMAASVRELWEKYQNFVKENPQRVSQFENIARFLSYVIPVKLDTSNVLSELLYSASNLLVLLNDKLLREDIRKYNLSDDKQSKFKSWLAILECLEVFLEVGAEKAGGPTFHWMVVICIQIFKTVLRYLLVKLYPKGLLTTPALPSLDRKKELEMDKPDSDENACSLLDSCEKNSPSLTFTLESSGRVVRKISAAPPLSMRTWELPEETKKEPEEPQVPTALSTTQLIAEKLYISRPLVHLLSMYMFGQRSWKPWFVASGVDLSSLCMMGEPKNFNKEERAELTRRTTMLLFYMLRSPFYDRFTKKRLIRMLQYIARTVPGLHLIINPLIDYLPTWQKYYFYVWNQ